MLTGWMPPTSLVRWMSMTSGRSRLRPKGVMDVVRVRPSACWRSWARGWTERSSSSIAISSPDELAPELSPASDVHRRFLGLFVALAYAQSGTGFSSSNCLRRRFVYSLPLTRSSASLIRSLRSRGFEANETMIRSSSLSTHAGGLPPPDVFSFSSGCCKGTPS